MAPAALMGFQDMVCVISLAEETAVITHSHELGIQGAALQACAIVLALKGSPSGGFDAGAFLEELISRVRNLTYQHKLEHVRELLATEYRAERKDVVSRLGNGIEAFNSVPTAIYSFLRSPESFKEVVTYAISLGGDTDTIASMAGALAGAFLGLDAIPETWRENVEDSAKLRGLADSLLSLARAKGL